MKLVEPGRTFIMEGTVMEVSNNKDSERKYFLLNDEIIFARPIKAKADAAIQWKLKDEIFLKRTEVRDVPDSDSTYYLFLCINDY